MVGKPVNDSGMNCPLWKKPVDKVCQKCEFWRKVDGLDPNTGKPLEDWRCAYLMTTTLQLALVQETVRAGAELSRFRQEVAQQNQDMTIANNEKLRLAGG